MPGECSTGSLVPHIAHSCSSSTVPEQTGNETLMRGMLGWLGKPDAPSQTLPEIA